ncbi:unnamed protein product [Allacma fusca]|uniref:Uncharacterized protein n=1 Tax=Allacma fusca TaxID=39272 RepID=A0A8J2NXB7_9HEXA|nr:unnamed protein product [Allacma fusca]
MNSSWDGSTQHNSLLQTVFPCDNQVASGHMRDFNEFIYSRKPQPLQLTVPTYQQVPSISDSAIRSHTTNFQCCVHEIYQV